MGAQRVIWRSLLLTFLRVYYYFYERSRGIILKSRGGGKAMSTAESIITGLIAGEYAYRPTARIGIPRFLRFCDYAHQQSYLGHSNVSGCPDSPIIPGSFPAECRTKETWLH